MVVGVCRVILNINEAFSLKEKRQVVKSIVERVKSRFNASVAEVGFNDKWKNAIIGISSDSMMANIVNFIENDGRVELVDYSTENIYVD